MSIEIRKVETGELLGDLFTNYREFAVKDYADMYPDEPPISENAIRSRLEFKDYEHLRFFAFENGAIVGFMGISRFSKNSATYEQNKNRVGLDGFVLPDYRRKGIGTRLARLVLSDPMSDDVQTLRTFSYNDHGERFASGLGGFAVEKSSNRTLELADVNWKLVKAWVEKDFEPDRKPAIEFYKTVDWNVCRQFVDIACAIHCELNEMDNRGLVTTRESIEKDMLDDLKYWEKEKLSHECFILKDKDGNLMGYTMCTFDPRNPGKAGQGMTCVWKHLRGFGYGKLLKALMLDNIRVNHPEVVNIFTSNNDLNDPMVTINHKLGFKEELQFCRYLVDKAKALEALKAKEAKWLK